MANANLIRLIYTDDMEQRDVLVTLGDTARAQDHAEQTVPDPVKPDLSADLSEHEIEFNLSEYRARKAQIDLRRNIEVGLYGMYLAAKRAHHPYTDAGYEAWRDNVTFEDDASDKDQNDDVEPGESSGPPSAD